MEERDLEREQKMPDILEGTCCCICLRYFEDKINPEDLYSHGEPVVCKDCWETLFPEDQLTMKKAVVDSIDED